MKKIKKVSLLLLTVALILSVFSAAAMCAPSSYGNFLYKTVDGNILITDCDANASGQVVVPLKIDNKPVKYIVGAAFENCTEITGITIDADLDTIWDEAFRGCTGLTSITISGVKQIEAEAFSGCTALKEVQLPTGTAFLGAYAFSGCTALEKVVIPASVTTIGDEIFDGCNDPIIYGALGSRADTYAQENDYLFTATSSGTSGVFTYEVRNGNVTITGCDTAAKGKISIPAEIGGRAVTAIAANAFSDCTQITAIEVPGSVKTIGQWAFYRCNALTSITFEEGVTTIDEGAFKYCSALTGVVFPKSLTTLGACVFDGCTALGVVTIPASVTKIGNQIFLNCSDKVEIWGYTGSKAESYAKANQIPFVSIGSVVSPFTDVKAGEYYEEAVNWAVANEITNGVSNTLFAPEDTCIRAQVVTFLWRAEGFPEPTLANSPFTDVTDKEAYYYKAVLWAVEKGITEGVSKTRFGVNEDCTRGQVVTFLWRAKGKPVATGSNPFNDVKAGEYYTEAVLWAVENGITKGTSNIAFSPDLTCTRGQIVTFLYRSYAK